MINKLCLEAIGSVSITSCSAPLLAFQQCLPLSPASTSSGSQLTTVLVYSALVATTEVSGFNYSATGLWRLLCWRDSIAGPCLRAASKLLALPATASPPSIPLSGQQSTSTSAASWSSLTAASLGNQIKISSNSDPDYPTTKSGG